MIPLIKTARGDVYHRIDVDPLLVELGSLRDEVPKLRAAVAAAAAWWKEHRSDTTGDHGEWNVYDEPPEFATLALEIVGEDA